LPQKPETVGQNGGHIASSPRYSDRGGLQPARLVTIQSPLNPFMLTYRHSIVECQSISRGIPEAAASKV